MKHTILSFIFALAVSACATNGNSGIGDGVVSEGEAALIQLAIEAKRTKDQRDHEQELARIKSGNTSSQGSTIKTVKESFTGTYHFYVVGDPKRHFHASFSSNGSFTVFTKKARTGRYARKGSSLVMTSYAWDVYGTHFDEELTIKWNIVSPSRIEGGSWGGTPMYAITK